MARGAISGITAELEAALAVLDPQIKGISDLGRHPISDILRAELNAAEAAMQQRRGLIQQVLDDIEKLLGDIERGGLIQQVVIDDIEKLLGDIRMLKADGYPVPQTFELSDPLLIELNGEVGEVQAGAGVFHAVMASTFEIKLGEPIAPPPLR